MSDVPRIHRAQSDADRLSAIYTCISAEKAAALLPMEGGKPVASADKMREWMGAGEITCIDVTGRGATRKSYVTTREWVAEFWARRMRGPAAEQAADQADAA